MGTPIGENHVVLDAALIAQATGGTVVRRTEGRVARGVTTDSRAVAPGGRQIAHAVDMR